MSTLSLKPHYLEKGDTIGLISPAAPLAGLVPHRTDKGIKMLEELGFKIKIGLNAMNITDHTAGTAEERASDINNFFADPEVKGIVSFIGGNHSNQILEYLDFDIIKKNPKVFIGYSDITVLHLAIYAMTELTTFYGPAVLTQFAENPAIMEYTKKYFLKAVTQKSPIGVIEQSVEWTDETLNWFTKEDLQRVRQLKLNSGWRWLKSGTAQGKLLGGCLASMMHLRGTKYWPDFEKAILFWEISEGEADFRLGESVSTIDAHLTDLELSGVFTSIHGMIIGRPFGFDSGQEQKLVEKILERTKKYSFPILYGVDIGHTDPMVTIPIGARVTINSDKNIFEILESGVR